MLAYEDKCSSKFNLLQANPIRNLLVTSGVMAYALLIAPLLLLRSDHPRNDQ